MPGATRRTYPARTSRRWLGTSASEEFLATTENGEDTYVRCTACDYAANVEAVVTPVPDAIALEGLPTAHVEETPDTPTIETLVAHANAHQPRDDRAWEAADTLKNVVLTVTRPDGTTYPLAIGLAGDREVDMKRLEAVLVPDVPAPMDEAEFARHPALVKGYIGPGALGEEGTSGIRYLVDPRVVEGTRWITGANEPGKHVFELVLGRDFTADGTIEAAEVLPGDVCPNCGSLLELARGIEIGHIFQLGRKYAEALDLQVLDVNGKLVTVTMGSYGIGVSRAVAAIAEQSFDELGLCWPREVAPADVHLVATGKDDAVFAHAEALALELEARGLRIILDDRRGASPGVKFKDSELIGVPTIVVVGKGLADGVIEIKDRTTGERDTVAVAEAVDRIVAACAS